MEKFSRWRDQGTGIQPFLPPVPANADHSPVEKVLTGLLLILKPVTGLVKFILVSVVALLLVLLRTIGLALSPLGPLHSLYRRLVTSVLVRLILALLGFFWIKHEVVTLRRGRSASSSKTSSSKRKDITSGDLIVSNWSSYIDVLYLAFRYDPVFTQIYPKTLTVREISFWEALRLSGCYPELSPPAGVETTSLLEFVKATHRRGAGPVVVFPEGTTTNNRAILKFVPIFKSCSMPETSINIQVVALKYEYAKFAPTFTVGLDDSYRLGHVFRTCAQLYNTLVVKTLSAHESPSNPNFSALDGFSSTTTTINNITTGTTTVTVDSDDGDALGAVIMNLMCRLTRFRKLGLTIQDKADFLDYFTLRNNGINSNNNNNTTLKKLAVNQKATTSSSSGSSRLKKR